MEQLQHDNYFSDNLGQSVLSILNSLSFEFDRLSAVDNGKLRVWNNPCRVVTSFLLLVDTEEAATDQLTRNKLDCFEEVFIFECSNDTD